MDFWDKTAKFYDFAEKLNGKAYREMCELTTKLTPRGANVLDCAAGTGELSLAAAKKADSVLCTDNSEKMLEVARKKAEKEGAFHIGFERRNIFHLDDPDETYDVVIAGNVLHLLDNPEDAVKELYRVTKSGGRILLPTFMVSRTGKMSSALLAIYGKFGLEFSGEYTPRSYVYMLKECNLGTVKAKLIKGSVPVCYAVIVKE